MPLRREARSTARRVDPRLLEQLLDALVAMLSDDEVNAEHRRLKGAGELGLHDRIYLDALGIRRAFMKSQRKARL